MDLDNANYNYEGFYISYGFTYSQGFLLKKLLILVIYFILLLLLSYGKLLANQVGNYFFISFLAYRKSNNNIHP
jgi:hypothetical protein